MAPPQSLSQPEMRDRLRLIRSDNIGPITFHQLIARYKSAGEALRALPKLAARGGRRAIRVCSQAQAEDEMAATVAEGAAFVHFGTPGYPELLATLPDAPPVLVVKGRTELMRGPGLAIVGARNASASGIRLTQTIAQDLGAGGMVVVSGLARGIDTAAHEGALKTGTIAVVAGGIDVIYPAENARLYEAITEGGLVVCEQPVGTKPIARHFPQRNRIISGLATGVLVVEAALRSGSLITARFALEQGRDVFAVPGSPLDPRHRGTNDLLRQGALLTESAEDILAEQKALIARERRHHSGVSERPKVAQRPQTKVAPPGSARMMLAEKLGPVPIEIDELIRQTGLTARDVLTILQELELAGELERHAGNRVSTR